MLYAKIILCWLALDIVIVAAWSLWGVSGPRIRPVHRPRNLREHPRHDGFEGFGFSQGVHSLHNGGDTL